METVEKTLTAKERVYIELEELKEKIKGLTAFIYGEDTTIYNSLSFAMKRTLRKQLSHMSDYAECLEYRLLIWGISDKDLEYEVY